jgi:beta-mannosidase
VFYDICDELGILVWQDFMFGCGNYPCFPLLLESIREESQANVRRLVHHPCLAIFAGNNEDYQVQESFGLTYDFKDQDPENWLRTDFPGRYIYEKVRPISALTPYRLTGLAASSRHHEKGGSTYSLPSW